MYAPCCGQVWEASESMKRHALHRLDYVSTFVDSGQRKRELRKRSTPTAPRRGCSVGIARALTYAKTKAIMNFITFNSELIECSLFAAGGWGVAVARHGDVQHPLAPTVMLIYFLRGN